LEFKGEALLAKTKKLSSASVDTKSDAAEQLIAPERGTAEPVNNFIRRCLHSFRPRPVNSIVGPTSGECRENGESNGSLQR
jgi:hypothetical protein